MPRYDGKPWTTININEASSAAGPWALIDTITIDPVSVDPSDPEPISFTTEKASLVNGWYKVNFADATGENYDTDPIHNIPANEIMATLDDVNAHLDGEVIEATPDNTDLIQVSVARMIRGFLSGLFDATTLMSWATPSTTPDTIREIASMLIAARVYFNEAARTSVIIDDQNFAQRLYDQAMDMLQKIVDGDIVIIDTGGGQAPSLNMQDGDFNPVDDTDRAFTMGMVL